MFAPIWRSLKKTLKWILILSFPLMFSSILTGVSSGILAAINEARHMKTVTESYYKDFADAKSDWGVPGAMSFRKFQDTKNDFHIVRLNSDDWYKKLHFDLPREFVTMKPGAPVPTIDKWADLNHLIRDISAHPSSPKEQWVFISDWAWPALSDWDAAFDEAIQYSYTNARLNNSGLWYASCSQTAKFLCEVWQVRAPTLIHFLVDDLAPDPQDMNPELTYRTHWTQLRRVTARLIEFPLGTDYFTSLPYTGLPSTVFPSRRKQLTSIMAGDKLYEQFQPYDEATQAMRRSNDYIREVFKTKGTAWYYINKVDSRVDDYIAPFGFREPAQVVHYICVALSMITTILGNHLYNFVADLARGFLGTPSDHDRELEEQKYDDLMGPNNPWDALMEGMVGGAKAIFEHGIQHVEAEKEPSPDAVTTDINRMRAELEQRMESILAQARATPGAPL